MKIKENEKRGSSLLSRNIFKHAHSFVYLLMIQWQSNKTENIIVESFGTFFSKFFETTHVMLRKSLREL